MLTPEVGTLFHPLATWNITRISSYAFNKGNWIY